MVSAKVMVTNPAGLHARPAGILAGAAGKCSSETIMIHDGKTIQLKSILNIMAAVIKTGAEVEIRCSGENEQADLEALVGLFDKELKNA